MPLTTTERRQIAARIRDAVPSVRDVLLFGSQARGEAREDSDVDLLLLVPEGSDRMAVAVAARRSLWGIDRGFDVLVLTPTDWQRLQASRAWLDRQMAQEAVRLDEVA